jgi:glycolate oxidase iron-sulfur subunit
LRERVAFHDAWHLGNWQWLSGVPRQVLRSIPGVELVELPDAALCCGSAGIYNLVEPAAAEELGRRKAANVRAAEPDAVATTNPGCLLQIRRHLDADRDPAEAPAGASPNGRRPAGAGLPLFHPVELVDASIRGVDPVAAADPARAAANGRALARAAGLAGLAVGVAVAGGAVAAARRRRVARD